MLAFNSDVLVMDRLFLSLSPALRLRNRDLETRTPSGECAKGNQEDISRFLNTVAYPIPEKVESTLLKTVARSDPGKRREAHRTEAKTRAILAIGVQTRSAPNLATVSLNANCAPYPSVYPSIARPDPSGRSPPALSPRLVLSPPVVLRTAPKARAEGSQATRKTAGQGRAGGRYWTCRPGRAVGLTLAGPNSLVSRGARGGGSTGALAGVPSRSRGGGAFMSGEDRDVGASVPGIVRRCAAQPRGRGRNRDLDRDQGREGNWEVNRDAGEGDGVCDGFVVLEPDVN
ncbi:unnamed protein product [Diplocarpon coronariae]